MQAELKRFNEVQTGKRNEYRRKLKEKEVDKGDGVGVPGDGEERAAKRVRRDGAARESVGTGGAAKETQRGKEDEMDQEADEQPEDLEVTATEELDAEPEAGEAEAEEEEDEENDDDDDDEDSSGVEQDDIDVDNADLRERAVRRGRRGGDGNDDDDDATSSGSEGASGTGSESRE